MCSRGWRGSSVACGCLKSHQAFIAEDRGTPLSPAAHTRSLFKQEHTDGDAKPPLSSAAHAWYLFKPTHATRMPLSHPTLLPADFATMTEHPLFSLHSSESAQRSARSGATLLLQEPVLPITLASKLLFY